MDLGDPRTASDPLGLFCARLKRLQAQSGIKQAALLGAAGLKRSQVSDILNGKIERPPDWGVTIAIVRACLEHAKADGRLVPPDLSDEADWQRRYFDLEQDLDTGARAKPRREEPAGRLLAEVTDPFALEVHHPVQPDGSQPSLPALPAYVAREHDTELGRVVAAAARGDSGVAALVGGSSTGKTRACWEALELLREQGRPWRLWHPIDPARPEAALRELPWVGPRTVVWLNEAQFYLDATGGLGERIAAGLREVLRDPDHAPVLVLATLWPQYWNVLTARPAARDDPHAQARELLAGRDITVPAAFTAASLRQLVDAADPRLAHAARTAEGGQVIQFLAGAPELLARYRNAPSAAAALIRTAMDARRLGMGVALPLAFLEAAAPGYLTDTDWDGLGEDWLEQALAYTAAPCQGIRGPLARIRPRPGIAAGPYSGPVYRLADYLEQHGRRARRGHIPADSFWDAAARFAAPTDLPALATAAEARGLLRDAARLRKHATTQGNASAAIALIRNWHSLPARATDPRPAQWAAMHAALDNPADVAQLMEVLREVGAEQQVQALLARDPAAHATLENPYGVARLMDALREADAEQQAQALAARDPAAHATLENPYRVARLMDALREADAEQQAQALAARNPAAHVSLDQPASVARLIDALLATAAEQQAQALAVRAAAHVALDNPFGIARMLRALQEADAEQQAEALLARNPAAHVSLDHPYGVAWLLDVLREEGAKQQAQVLLARNPAAHVSLNNAADVGLLLDALRRAGAEQQVQALLARNPAAHVSLNNLWNVARLLAALREAGAEQQAQTLLARDPGAHGTLENPVGVAELIDALREEGAEHQAQALVARIAAHVSLDEPAIVAQLIDVLREAGAEQQAQALLARSPGAHVSLDKPAIVAQLIDVLREAGAEQQVQVLLARNPAMHAAFDNPYGVARLLDVLREVGAEQQVQALLARDPGAHVSLDEPGSVGLLLVALQEVGAEQQAATLVDRLPAEGQYAVYRRQPGHEPQYRFGREPDGSPAPSWGWDDLD